MTAPDIAAALTQALEAAAAREGGEGAVLVSMQWELLAAPAAGAAEAHIARKTRTLVFITAAYRDTAGALIATASSVHRLA